MRGFGRWGRRKPHGSDHDENADLAVGYESMIEGPRLTLCTSGVGSPRSSSAAVLDRGIR